MNENYDIPDLDGEEPQINGRLGASTKSSNGSARISDRAKSLSKLPDNVEEADFDLIKFAKATLRGRYALLISTGLLCGTLLGYAGWRFGHQTYHSSGLVRIAFELPKVMTDTDQNSPIQMFDTFMQSQRMLIGSRRVLDVAMQDPIWRTTGRPIPADPDDYFARHFKIDISPRSEFIEISASDTDPGTSYAAASSVVSAYQQLYNQQEEQREKNRIGWLEDKQRMIEGDIQQIYTQILAGSQEFGSSDLDLFFANAADRVNTAKTALERVRTSIAMAGTGPDTAKTADQHSPPAQANLSLEMTVPQIAAVDQTMRTYVDRESALEDELKELSLRIGSEHDVMKIKRQEIDNVKERIDQYADSYRVLHAPGMQKNSESSATLPTLTTVEDLTASEARLEKVWEREQNEMVAIGKKKIALKHLDDELIAKKKENDELLGRISVLRAERSLGGRLSLTSTPEIPLSPDKDQRLPYGIAGALMGFSFPAALALGLAFISRGKFRFADDTNRPLNTDIPLLGILPMIPNRLSTHEDCANAAHSIHQLRVSLRAQAPVDRPSNVYLVTSSTAGEGKTSLAMALGLSLAAAGHRTLIMDCDMIGRHLTTKLKMRNLKGLKEAMAIGHMRKMIRPVNNNLYAFPVGQIGRGDACSMSMSRMAPLLASARKAFDTVLIDTGPILGSVEAAVLAQEVDGVVFVIGRDQARPLVERALERLQNLGARVEGLVFNRARRDDFRSSIYASSSTRSTWDEGTPRLLPPPSATPFDDFGPLVTSMMSELPDRETTDSAPE